MRHPHALLYNKEEKLVRSCSFTGHREIESRHRETIGPLVVRAIEYAYNEGCRRFYLGGALGFDTIAAQKVILFRMTHPDAELHLLLPCKDQEKNWSYSQREMYGYILGQADTVTYVSDIYTDGCMRERNRLLAERGDIMIAYLGRPRSGAAQTVRMARELGKTVYNLFDKQ